MASHSAPEPRNVFTKDGATINNDSSVEDNSLQILKARIALLSTAIGGPDHTSEVDPPPYKIGDDCLACLKDLKRWFKLVDDKPVSYTHLDVYKRQVIYNKIF